MQSNSRTECSDASRHGRATFVLLCCYYKGQIERGNLTICNERVCKMLSLIVSTDNRLVLSN